MASANASGYGRNLQSVVNAMNDILADWTKPNIEVKATQTENMDEIRVHFGDASALTLDLSSTPVNPHLDKVLLVYFISKVAILLDILNENGTIDVKQLIGDAQTRVDEKIKLFKT